jgi:geranylgeranyl diphosphate synthase, type I
MYNVSETLEAPQPLEAALLAALTLEDEGGLGRDWAQAWSAVRAYVLRPGKRFRPALLTLGYRAARSAGEVPRGVAQFAAGLELLHAFLLVHDDVADRAATRRGGPALHRQLAPSSDARGAWLGEQLAIVAGDHLYSRALEVMLGSGLPGAAAAAGHLLSICRHTAVGQYLDLSLSRTPLAEVTLFDTLRVAHLKTARYGFVAPLVCGAMLGGASPSLLEALARAGRHAGIAFQLRDDLIGLFGLDRLTGKAGAGDYFEAKRTFPVIAAWTRADEAGRAELEALWDASHKDQASCERARAAISLAGGRAATERAIERSGRAASRALSALPAAARPLLEAAFTQLLHRAALSQETP